VVTGTADREPNANGWYKTPVTITWTVTDPPPSSGPTVPAELDPTVATTEGSVDYVSDPACDPEGFCTRGHYVVSLDTDAPEVSVTGVEEGRQYADGFVPAAGCSATDTRSGVAVQPVVSLVDHGDGGFTATCTGAVDYADNQSAAAVAHI
jgi:hypothetical protein